MGITESVEGLTYCYFMTSTGMGHNVWDSGLLLYWKQDLIYGQNLVYTLVALKLLVTLSAVTNWSIKFNSLKRGIHPPFKPPLTSTHHLYQLLPSHSLHPQFKHHRPELCDLITSYAITSINDRSLFLTRKVLAGGGWLCGS